MFKLKRLWVRRSLQRMSRYVHHFLSCRTPTTDWSARENGRGAQNRRVKLPRERLGGSKRVRGHKCQIILKITFNNKIVYWDKQISHRVRKDTFVPRFYWRSGSVHHIERWWLNRWLIEWTFPTESNSQVFQLRVWWFGLIRFFSEKQRPLWIFRRSSIQDQEERKSKCESSSQDSPSEGKLFSFRIPGNPTARSYPSSFTYERIVSVPSIDLYERFIQGWLGLQYDQGPCEEKHDQVATNSVQKPLKLQLLFGGGSNFKWKFFEQTLWYRVPKFGELSGKYAIFRELAIEGKYQLQGSDPSEGFNQKNLVVENQKLFCLFQFPSRSQCLWGCQCWRNELML